MQTTLAQPSDERLLVERAKKRDPVAFSTIYDRYAQAIYQYVYYRTGDKQTAEDLTAEVFLRVLESIDKYEDRGLPLIAWLFRIAHARVIDYWRHNQLHPQVELQDTSMGQHAMVEQPFRDVWADRELVQALNKLTDEQQQVLVLRFVQDLDMATIAQIMGKTVGAIKALQHRALASLARVMKD